jgi:hypothetical protein
VGTIVTALSTTAFFGHVEWENLNHVLWRDGCEWRDRGVQRGTKNRGRGIIAAGLGLDDKVKTKALRVISFVLAIWNAHILWEKGYKV